MITQETVMAALPASEDVRDAARVGSAPLAPGWTTTGHVAMRFTDYPEGTCKERPWIGEKFAQYLKQWSEDVSRRVPVIEDDSFWIPPIAEIPDETAGNCDRCNGDGFCECHCGDEHDCQECNGEGKIITKRGRREKIGQAVFRSEDGARSLIQGKFAGLLRGYSVFRFVDPAGNGDPLLGVDADGTLMVVVMPMIGTPYLPSKPATEATV